MSRRRRGAGYLSEKFVLRLNHSLLHKQTRHCNSSERKKRNFISMLKLPDTSDGQGLRTVGNKACFGARTVGGYLF